MIQWLRNSRNKKIIKAKQQLLVQRVKAVHSGAEFSVSKKLDTDVVTIVFNDDDEVGKYVISSDKLVSGQINNRAVDINSPCFQIS